MNENEKKHLDLEPQPRYRWRRVLFGDIRIILSVCVILFFIQMCGEPL